VSGQPDVAVIVASADGGISWTRVATLPQRVLLLTSQDSGLIVLSGSGAYRIANDGSTTELGSIPSGIRAASSAHSGGAVWIYATGQDGKVYLSQDSGLHFRPVTPKLQQTAGNFEAIAACDRHPEFAYAGFRGLQIGEGKENLFNGIAKTTDGGHTWKIVFKESDHAAANLSGTWVEQRARQENTSIWFDAPSGLGVAPNNPAVVYATEQFRTYRTLDGGAIWQETNSKGLDDGSWVSRGVDLTTNYGVQFDPFDSQHIFIDNTDMGLFQSTNGGKSWRSTSEGISEDWRNTTYWLAFYPSQRGLIWAAFSGTHDLPHPKMWRGRAPGSSPAALASQPTAAITGSPADREFRRTQLPTFSSTQRVPPAIAFCMLARLVWAFTSPLTTAEAGPGRTTALSAKNLSPGASLRPRTGLSTLSSPVAARAWTAHCLELERFTARRTRRNTGNASRSLLA
jgi:hypothetical protein